MRLPVEAIEFLDRRADRRGTTRAQMLRTIVAEAMSPADASGVDRAQIQRQLRMSPAQRVAHMTDVANRMRRLRGIAVDL